MILKDIVPAEKSGSMCDGRRYSGNSSRSRKQQIRLATERVCEYTKQRDRIYDREKSEENYETALNYLKTVRFDYLVAPSVETDGQLSAVTSYVKNERKANKLISSTAECYGRW